MICELARVLQVTGWQCRQIQKSAEFIWALGSIAEMRLAKLGSKIYALAFELLC